MGQPEHAAESLLWSESTIALMVPRQGDRSCNATGDLDHLECHDTASNEEIASRYTSMAVEVWSAADGTGIS